MHRFHSFEECERFIQGWIHTEERKLEYLNSLPQDYREYYESSEPFVVLEFESCRNRKLLCGNTLFNVLECMISNFTQGEKTYDNSIDFELVQEVVIDCKDDIINFIKSEFFTAYKE